VKRGVERFIQLDKKERLPQLEPAKTELEITPLQMSCRAGKEVRSRSDEKGLSVSTAR
jgi:hypothetical protein